VAQNNLSIMGRDRYSNWDRREAMGLKFGRG